MEKAFIYLHSTRDIIILVHPIPSVLSGKIEQDADRVVGKWETSKGNEYKGTKTGPHHNRIVEREAAGRGNNTATANVAWIGQAEAKTLIFFTQGRVQVPLSVPRITRTRAENLKKARPRRKRSLVFCFSGLLASFLSRSTGFG